LEEETEELWFSSPLSTTTAIGVYEISFQDETETIKVSARFFIGEPFAGPNSYHPSYMLCADDCATVTGQCSDSHLTLNPACVRIVHLSRIADPSSQPYYDKLAAGRRWAVSQDHRFFCHFGGTDYYWRAHSPFVFRECEKYDRHYRIRPAAPSEAIALSVVPLSRH
jgi:hypothetical protein